MDKICLCDLEINTIIGTMPEERLMPRPIVLNIELCMDLSAAGKNDDLHCSADYQKLAEKLIELGRCSSFRLIEAFAEKCAEICLDDPLIQLVNIRVCKPSCVVSMRAAAVEITRSRA